MRNQAEAADLKSLDLWQSSTSSYVPLFTEQERRCTGSILEHGPLFAGFCQSNILSEATSLLMVQNIHWQKRNSSLRSAYYFQSDATTPTQRSIIDKKQEASKLDNKTVFSPCFHSSPRALLDITARAPVNDSQQSFSAGRAALILH